MNCSENGYSRRQTLRQQPVEKMKQPHLKQCRRPSSIDPHFGDADVRWKLRSRPTGRPLIWPKSQRTTKQTTKRGKTHLLLT